MPLLLKMSPQPRASESFLFQRKHSIYTRPRPAGSECREGNWPSRHGQNLVAVLMPLCMKPGDKGGLLAPYVEGPSGIGIVRWVLLHCPPNSQSLLPELPSGPRASSVPTELGLLGRPFMGLLVHSPASE